MFVYVIYGLLPEIKDMMMMMMMMIWATTGFEPMQVDKRSRGDGHGFSVCEWTLVWQVL